MHWTLNSCFFLLPKIALTENVRDLCLLQLRTSAKIRLSDSTEIVFATVILSHFYCTFLFVAISPTELENTVSGWQVEGGSVSFYGR